MQVDEVRAAIHKTRHRFVTPIALIVVAGLLAALAPLPRHHYRHPIHRPAPVVHHSALSRHRPRYRGGWPVPLVAAVNLLSATCSDVATRVVSLILGAHRLGFAPVPITRLKLSPDASDRL